MALRDHNTATGQDLHVDLRIKESVRVASTTNVTLTAPGTTIDGVTMVAGDRLLLKDQTTANQNGIYIWNGAASTATRAADADVAVDFVSGFQVYVRLGTVNANTYWQLSQNAAITLGTTAITFSPLGQSTVPTSASANTVYAGPTGGGVATPTFRTIVNADLPSAPTVSGEVSARDFAPSGLTGANAPTRFVGGTVSGAPNTGTFAVGDYVVDSTGKLWICTGAGTPGTWTQASGTMTNPMTTNQDIIVGGTSGAPNRVAVGANGQVLGVTAGVIGWLSNPSGFANPMTQIGDMITGGTAGAATRLGIGANGQVLTVIGGQPGWANPAGGGGGGTTNNTASSLYLAATFI